MQKERHLALLFVCDHVYCLRWSVTLLFIISARRAEKHGVKGRESLVGARG